MADDQDIERAEQERLKGGMGQQNDAGQGAEQAGLAANDQAGGGLGQNQTGYGGGNAPSPTGGIDTAQDAEAQASQGVGTRSDNIGPSPTGANQPRSATTGGPDLSSGLKDSNRGGGNF
jgi:nucleoid-associated protein YgaU